MDICVFSARTNTVTQLIIKPTKIMKILKLKLKLPSPLFQDYAIKAEIDLELLVSEDQKTKQNKNNTLSSISKRPTTQIQVAAGKPG